MAQQFDAEFKAETDVEVSTARKPVSEMAAMEALARRLLEENAKLRSIIINNLLERASV